MGVRVSKQFGVNPSVDTCVCCGKEMGVILFGAAYKDENDKTAEAPMHTCSGHLCDECKKVIDNGGIFFIEVRDGEHGSNPYRTGRIVAVKEEAAKRVFKEYAKINYMEHSIFDRVFGSAAE